MAIERHVYIRLKPEHQSPLGRRALQEASAKLAHVPGVTALSLRAPADEHALAAWDLCLVLEFEDLDAVAGYRDHPDHRAYVDTYLAEHAAVIKAWNFEC